MGWWWWGEVHKNAIDCQKVLLPYLKNPFSKTI
jgi:hypothetical protein